MRKIFLTILSAAFLICSCNKTIDKIRPSDSIDEGKALTTITDLEQGGAGAYASISGENIIYVGSIMSDDVKISPENRGQGQFLHKWTHTSNDGDAGRAWQNLYIGIDRANRVLAAIPKIPAATPAEQAVKDKVKGEMLALRAFCHFELLRWYAPAFTGDVLGVPYMKEPGIGQPKRDNISSNYTSIKQDLNEAKTLIPTSFTNITHITKNGVAAIQARVALYERDYAGAITYATEVINNISLASSANFPGIWTDANTSEVIWKLKRNSTQQVSTLWKDVNGDVFFLPSDKLKGSYDRTNDVRFGAYILANPGNADPDDTLIVNKYPGIAGAPYTNDIKLFRVAEMYLIRAEAKAEQSTPDLVGATADLVSLRSQRINGYVPEVFANKDELINAILTERFKEFPFEGHRYFDLKRRGLPIQRSATDAAPEYSTLQPTNYLYILPIPQREIFANDNMDQNKGYE